MLARLSALVPEIGSALRRFPEAALVSLLGTVLGCALATEVFGTSGPAFTQWTCAYYALVVLWPVAFAIGLYAERHALAPARRAALLTIATVLIGLLVTFRFKADLSMPILLGAAMLIPAIAAHLRQPKDNAAFWMFNHDLWLGFAMAVIGGGLVALSFTVIYGTLTSLFQIDVGSIVYRCTMVAAASLAGPLIWLTLAPRRVSGPAVTSESAIDTQQTSSRAIALVSKFILVPVLFVYTAIIYVYGVKIALDGALPKGQIGWMVLLYGITGTATLLAVYPTRNSGGVLVSLFWRSWFLIVLPPVALLFLAVLTRTEQYGITDRRYLVVLAGIWLIAMALLFGLRREEARDLRTIVLSIAAFLAVAMAGPWGAIGLTTRQLAADFNAIAATSSAFKGGKFDSGELDEPTRQRLVSILKYLGESGRLDLVYPLVADAPAAKNLNIAPAADASAREDQAAVFADFVGLPGFRISPAVQEGRTYFSFHASKPATLQVSGVVAGPVVLTSEGTQDRATVTGPDGEISIKLERKAIMVTLPDSVMLTYDAMAIADTLSKAQSGYMPGARPYRFSATQGSRSADLIVVAGYGSSTGLGVDVNSLTIWLVVSK